MEIFSLSYSLPYLILLCFYVLFFLIEKTFFNVTRIRTLVLILCCLFYFVFFGFRGYIGYDWFSYLPRFEECKTLDNLNFTKVIINPEFGFILWMAFLKSINSSYLFFQVISALVNLTLLHLFFLRYSKYYSLGFLIFLIMNGIAIQVDLLRNSVSILLFLYSLRFIQEKKWILYFAVNLVGATFHLTSLFYFPLYFFLDKNFISKKLLIFIFVVGNLVYLCQIPVLKPLVYHIVDIFAGKFGFMLKSYIKSRLGGISIGYIERTFTALLIIYFYDKLIKRNCWNILFLNSYLLYFIFYTFLSDISVIALRMGMLFVFSYWVLWPEILILLKIKTNKIIIFTAFLVYGFLKINFSTNTFIFKYDNFFAGLKSKHERVATYKAHIYKLSQNE